MRRTTRRRRQAVAITVTKATPAITWATPADIVYGTALSATQLNATTTVAGTFVYTPRRRDGARRRRGADAVGDLHADRCGELHHGDASRSRSPSRRRRRSITWPTPADIIYGTALERDAVERDGRRCPARSSTRPRLGTVLSAGAAQSLVGDLHADRRRPTTRRRRRRSRSQSPRRHWSSPGRRPPTSSTARA